MKILVTGGSGFIGSHLVEHLSSSGHDVTIFDPVFPRHTPSIRYVQGDIQDPNILMTVTAHADLVIHAGGVLGTHETVEASIETAQANIIGTLNVLDAVKRADTRLIFISKPNVWLNPYSITKDCAEKFAFMYAEEFGTQVCIIKLFNVYGPRQKYHVVRKAIPTWIVDALNGKPIEIFGSGLASVDLIHTSDVAKGIAGVIENFDKCKICATPEVSSTVYGSFPNHDAQILELGSGRSTSVNETVAAICEAMGRSVEIRRLAMRRGEIDNTQLCADMARMRSLTGFSCGVTLVDGLRDTLQYYERALSEVEEGLL